MLPPSLLLRELQSLLQDPLPRRSYLGDYLSSECSVPNAFTGPDAFKNYFDPMNTLFIAVVVVSLHMWSRRLLNALSALLEGSIFKNADAIAGLVKLSIRAAAKQPIHVQEALQSTLRSTGKASTMPKTPSFGALVLHLDARVAPSANDKEGEERDLEANR
jgi:hypothetical protein